MRRHLTGIFSARLPSKEELKGLYRSEHTGVLYFPGILPKGIEKAIISELRGLTFKEGNIDHDSLYLGPAKLVPTPLMIEDLGIAYAEGMYNVIGDVCDFDRLKAPTSIAIKRYQQGKGGMGYHRDFEEYNENLVAIFSFLASATLGFSKTFPPKPGEEVFYTLRSGDLLLMRAHRIIDKLTGFDPRPWHTVLNVQGDREDEGHRFSVSYRKNPQIKGTGVFPTVS